MIDYIEKYKIHEAMRNAGLYMRDRDGVWQSAQNHDVINQFIIDYDEVAVLKDDLKQQLITDSQTHVDNMILSRYPKFEVDSWQNQIREAKAYLLDNNADVPTIEEIAAQRNVTKLVVANKILTKMATFAAFSGKQAGRRQRLEDLIDAASTVEQLNAIPKFTGV